MPAHRKWTDAQLAAAVAASASMAEVHQRIGLRAAGGITTGIGKHIGRLGLDTSHFKGQGWAKAQYKRADEVRADLLPLLRRGPKKVAQLRERLIASGLKEARCEECRITEWRGHPAPLQVDHVDGDRLNNELANLMILCANCHVLTETWGFKGARRRPVKRWWRNGSRARLRTVCLRA